MADDEVWMIAAPSIAEELAVQDIAAMPWIHTRDLPAAWTMWSETTAPEAMEHMPRAGSDHSFDFFIMAIRATVAGLGLALLPRVLIDQELASGLLVRVGDYAAINAQKTYLMFPEQRRDWAPFVAFSDWIQSEMTLYRAERRMQMEEAPH